MGAKLRIGRKKKKESIFNKYPFLNIILIIFIVFLIIYYYIK